VTLMPGNHKYRRPRTALSKPIAAPTAAGERISEPKLPLQSYRGTSKAALERMLALRPRDKLLRFGMPIKIKEADWLAYGAGRAELPESKTDELEVRMMILAEYFGVDPFDPDWWNVTTHRVAVTLLSGGGAKKRRFPTWVLSTEQTSLSKPFPVNGPFRVIRPDGMDSTFTNRELDEAEALLAGRAKGVTKIDAVAPLLERIKGSNANIKKRKLTEMSLVNAVRYRSRSRRKSKRQSPGI